MSGYAEIKQKLESFYKKFYLNQLIKGTILFFSLGFLYFIFTLLVEYLFWLNPLMRTVLFWVFVVVELFFIIKFVAIPVLKLTKLQSGIDAIESSKIIGNHFPEVKDKLLNIIQLKESSDSELVLASINQKSKELKPIPFQKAINFKTNITYLKYAVIPIIIWLIFWISGFQQELNNSLTRVVNYNTTYTPTAPFSFSVESNLRVIQGEDFKLKVTANGKVLPEDVKIRFNNQEYFLQRISVGDFQFLINNVTEDINFYIEANGIRSQDYVLEVIKTPTIQNIAALLEYPNYTKRADEKLENISNISVAEGTKITWNVSTNQTDSLTFICNQKRTNFAKASENQYQLKKKIYSPITYQITSSNSALKDFEKLQYNVNVIKDEFPKIQFLSNIDSISSGEANFFGQISDDYGITKLVLIYYDIEKPSLKKSYSVKVSKENVQTFMYNFPKGLELQEGINYELFFEVYDNDAVNGNKKATSKKFEFRQKTTDEIEEELLEEQKNYVNSLQKSLQQQQKQKKDLQKIQNDIQNKKDINWNDKKKVDEFIKRQNQYKQMMQRQTEKLQENLSEKMELTPSLEEQKEQLKKRLEELKKQEQQQKLLNELQKIAEKLNKDDLVRKAKQLAQQNKQQERSLERILELTKRFYVEQKSMQMANKLEKLSKEQDKISNEDNSLQKQEELEKKFEDLKKELQELKKDNNKLKEPMPIPDMEEEKKEVEKAIKNAKDNLQRNQKPQAKKDQKKASKKMKEMSRQMKQSMMDMQSTMINENIDDLRKILKNLVTFSFKQEDLMNNFIEMSVGNPDFGKKLKKQNEIKTYFEHIDDSLYVLSMRVPQISAKIQDDIASTYYNLDQSLYNFSENRFNSGVSNQQYVMTSVNNLADFLSNMLDNMQSSLSQSGKSGMQSGKKGKGSGEGMQDLIQKQKGLSEKMKEGLNKGKQKGSKGNEGSDGEMYKIYQEQNMLRQQLKEMMQKRGIKEGAGNAKQVEKTMEDLENDILQNGLTKKALDKMQSLEYQLLKLESALKQQGEDNKRKSNTNMNMFQQKRIREIQLKKQFYNQIEILNRQSLPLQQIFKTKVQEYFSKQID